MFDAFVSWMFAPGMWNDGIVYLIVLLLVFVGYMLFSKD